MLNALYDFKTIALVSGLVCVVVSVNAFVQTRFFAQHAPLLRVFGLSILSAGISLIGTSLTEGAFSVERLALVWIPGTIALWMGFICARGVFSHFPRNTLSLLILAIALWPLPFLTGSAWGEVWLYLMQASLSFVCFFVVLRGREPTTPGARLLVLGLTALNIVAPLYLVIAIASNITELGPNAWAVMPDRVAGPALVWGLTPIIYSFAFFSIINARLSVQLLELADYDGLTGMKVRRKFYEESQRVIDRHNSAHQEVAVMMIDIDNFKSINDSYGHPVGDSALQHVAKIIKSTIRADTLVARYGGEEFCVLSHVNDRREGHAIAERIRARVEALPLPLQDAMVSMSVSVGVAFHKPFTTIETLLDEADRHLYAAKRAGRNRVAIADIGPEAAPAS